jgi:hypothetical protein
MDAYDVLIAIAVVIFILSSLNYYILQPRIKREEAEKRVRRPVRRLRWGPPRL